MYNITKDFTYKSPTIDRQQEQSVTIPRDFNAQQSRREIVKRTLGRNSLIEPKDVRNGCQMSFIREASGSTAFAQVHHGAPIPQFHLCERTLQRLS